MHAGAAAMTPPGTSGTTPNSPDLVSSERVRHAAIALVGALTAIGTMVLSSVAVLAVALVVSHVRDTSPGSLAAGLAAGALRISIVGALVLSAIVLVSFGCGGYVAARLSEGDGRRQAVAVWVWAMLLPVLFVLGALASAAHDVVTTVRPNGAGTVLLATLAMMALLGALLGGETVRGSRRVCASR